MSSLRVGSRIVRRSFAKIKDIVPVPNLIEIQSKSFNDFAQLDFLAAERENIGLEKVFKDVFPIDYGDKMSLEYVSYELGNWSCTCGKLTGIVHRYTWSCSSCEASGCSRLNESLSCPSCNKKTARYKTCPNCLSRVGVKIPLSLEECRSSGQTFSMPLKVKVQLISWDVSPTGERVVRDIKEQEAFFADVPVMADLYEVDGRYKLGNLGTFVINGVERVIVSQLHRSPGVVFSQSKKVKDVQGKPYYVARIIPMRGAWLDFEFDSYDYLYVRVDKKKKILITTFLQALGVARADIIPLFYASDTIIADKGGFYQDVNEKLLGSRLRPGMADIPDDSPYLGRPITREALDWLKKTGIKRLELESESLLNRVFSNDVVSKDSGEILVEQGQVFTQDHCSLFERYKNLTFDLIVSAGYVSQPTIPLTLAQDRCANQEDALRDVHSKVWPGDGASLREVKERLEHMLFGDRLYDLTRVGRIRMNRKLGLSVDEGLTVLTRDDIFATIRYLVNLRERGEGELDDIDHLGNRRVRLVGELLANQVYIGLLRIDRIVRERFRIQEMHGALMPQDFLNVKPLNAVIREFFGTGQLSQYVDQTNPLSEIAHKRRLSALGPGGVMKDRATYEIRDVHTSHYGRICPIETPEGQTIGLISSLATYALVNELGFIETAYRPVKKNEILDDVVFLDAFEETDAYIAQADVIKKGGDKITGSSVFARHGGNFLYAATEKINYVDLSPKQLVSVATALIPFLEHDDASRALMGANMQRQAVPLVRTQTPIVATGMEAEIARASGACLTARRPGVVEYVSSEKIVIRADETAFGNVDDWIAYGVETYHLRKFQLSSHNTWVHQTPCVKVGDIVKPGDMLSNSSAIEQGELALGANLLVAFMPWNGYNFEDAIVLNKRLVAEDVLTSVHIDEYVVEARDTKLGPEEITRDIPNVSEGALAGLDEDGIVRVGTRVAPGDILVGKVTLKGGIQYSPEEKLLRAIFGEKSREVRDTSLRVPPGVEGTVVDVKIFSRSGMRKDKRYKAMVTQESERFAIEFAMHKSTLEKMLVAKLSAILDGLKPLSAADKEFLTSEGVFAGSKLAKQPLEKMLGIKTKDKEVNALIIQLRDRFDNQMRILNGLHEERINKLKKGDPLPSGVIKMIKVYISMKRPIQVGDKIAGRHGNKGVVSLIVPREDMPYMEDGQAVDIVLNPLGVPSRMNLGQILETILGFSGVVYARKIAELLLTEGYNVVKKQLETCYGKDLVKDYEKAHGEEGVMDLARSTARQGVLYKTPVFDGPSFENDIQPILRDVGLPETGTFRIYDGRSGECFDQTVTVGAIYMMKLNHMVDDKLHARSVGPYSLVTQQPLGGKAQMGGQRLGEMEVWALEAYGASYTLQEMLTYKSDDVSGRHKVYEAIVRGEEVPEPGLPESFNVMIKELQSLGLRIDLFKSGKEEVSE
ncbi:TPA: DNA-directed RNA polymerase subunit beta [Candidatus Dependentiae bacterium]|nr:MAG: DNA-directed RNA polymerase subunit beta [candidate division TM6 bacterium GW2011_GWF2_43_87]HBL98427.1 DNA-directed RNA polymerase subunit beta [Candidatus Dependentiae bacterium]